MKKITTFLISIMLLAACTPNPTIPAAPAEAAAPVQATVENMEELLPTAIVEENSEPAPVQEEMLTESSEVECLICNIDLSSYEGPLSPNEIQGLLLALNDEYHAWAVYDQVLADFGNINPFSNIRNSEATHIEMLKDLFETYQLEIPENAWIGNAPSFSSSAEACQAGVDAEIQNVSLYDQLYASTTREDITAVYEVLQRASNEQHLPAFERCSTSGGGNGRKFGGK